MGLIDDAAFEPEGLGDGTREWWPQAAGERPGPPGRADPLDWLLVDRQRRFFLDLPDETGTRLRLRVGERLDFAWRECRALVEVTVEPDGSFEPHGAAPRDATDFWEVGDRATRFASLDDLAAYRGETLTSPARIRIRMCRSSRAPVGLRLELAGGRARLVPV